MKSIECFKNAGFGIMVHFGLYSILEGEYKGERTNEWVRHSKQIPYEEYHKLTEAFNPIYFNSDEWISAVKESGAKYFVVTAKHHEGFALFNSKVSDFNVMNTPFKRDIIKELAESCKKYGIKFGLYYSHDQDWDEEGGGGFIENPYANPGNNTWDFLSEKRDFEGYLKNKSIPQVKELLTNYGDIFLIWFDNPWTVTREQSHEFYHLVKSLQPDCLVNERVGNDLWDIKIGGDNEINMKAYKNYANEVPVTLSGEDCWSFSVYNNMSYKSIDEIRTMKKQLNSKGVNLLLNIGPDHLGRFPGPALKILKELGK